MKGVQTYVAQHPELWRPVQLLPRRSVGTAATFVAEVAPKIPRR